MLSLYKEFYGNDGILRFQKRIPWYRSHKDFHLLMAEYDGEYVGQACCYKADIFVSDCISWIYWGVDTFVLSKMRGKGIGKKLQAKLHEDWPNFSSAWYSKTNGIIKKKCGGHEIFPVEFCFYPVSKLYTTYIDRILRKFLKIEANVHFPIPYIYARLNSRSSIPYTYRETEFSPKIVKTMQQWLKDSDCDFYLLRSEEFVRWKYIENPNLRYHVLEIIKENTVCGYLVFSHIFTTNCLGGNANVSNLLDYVFAPEENVSIKNIVRIITSFYKRKGEVLDGVRAIGASDYKFIQRPKAPVPMLSTMTDVKISRPYLTYIDQDMEQM